MVAGLFFTFALVALFLVSNAMRKPTAPSHRFPPIWLFGMITSEMAGLWLLVMAGVATVAVVGGGMKSAVGRLGMVLLGAAALGQLEVWRRSRAGARAVGPPVSLPESLPARLFAYPRSIPDGVHRTRRDLAPHPHRPSAPLVVDLYRPRSETGPLPLVIYVHGGGWRGGDPRVGGQVIIQHLASRKWAVAAIEYPLSPAATFPEHLVGIDAALDWAAEDPGIEGPVVLMGASAGAHLAAVAALKPPSVDGLVGLYGIYDLLNRHGTRPTWPVIPNVVMKGRPEDDPESYRLASPLDLVDGQGPPTFLVTGTYDSLVPPEESRIFAEALKAAGADVTLLEVPWAQHAFDVLAGPRARAVAGAIGAWLDASVIGGDKTHNDRSRDPGIR